MVNVLRILRAAQPRGLTCAAIGSRMITAEPDITRLLARLKTLKLIRRQFDAHDRRAHWTHIAPAFLPQTLVFSAQTFLGLQSAPSAIHFP